MAGVYTVSSCIRSWSGVPILNAGILFCMRVEKGIVISDLEIPFKEG